MGKSGGASRRGVPKSVMRVAERAASKQPTLSKNGKPLGRPPGGGSKKAGDALRAEAARMRELIRPDREDTTPFRESVKQSAARDRAVVNAMKGNQQWAKLVRDMRVSADTMGGVHFTKAMMVATVIRAEWTNTDMDASPLNVALRSVAAEEFHLGNARGAFDPAVQRAADEFKSKYGGALRQFVQHTYNATQKWFADHNIHEVTLYRGTVSGAPKHGISYNGKASSAHYSGSAFTSFSSDPQVAYDYAVNASSFRGSDHHAMLAARVPVRDIFGAPDVSMAKATESEFLVMARPQSWKAVGWMRANEEPGLDRTLNLLGAAFSKPSRSAASGSSRARSATSKATTTAKPARAPRAKKAG